MSKKDILNDAINIINAALTSYATMISQTDDPTLRSTLIQIRNRAETSQNELYQIAKELNFNVPVQQSSQEDILNTHSTNNYISSQSNGILAHMDEQTKHALQSPPRS